jgi:hypothetical protein
MDDYHDAMDNIKYEAEKHAEEIESASELSPPESRGPTKVVDAVPTGWGPNDRARAHPPAPNQREAVRRLETLISRLRYAGREYDADIAEREVLPYLKAPNPCVSASRRGSLNRNEIQ